MLIELLETDIPISNIGILYINLKSLQLIIEYLNLLNNLSTSKFSWYLHITDKIFISSPKLMERVVYLRIIHISVIARLSIFIGKKVKLFTIITKKWDV